MVHLIDASPYIFRAYFALREPIRDPAGRDVSAIYGFLGFLVRFLREQEPTHLALGFDKSLTTSFRNEIYPAYKAQRPLPPPDLVAQLEDCERVATAMGVRVFQDIRYEADDFLATLAAQLNAPCTVVSNDKDLAQLVSERVTWFDFAKDLRYDIDGVVAKFGVRPDQIPDFLGLAGDSVDNIPGVKGVGQKTAVALLNHFGTLEALYERLEEVPGLAIRGAKSVRDKLARDKDNAFLSKTLATAATDAPARVTLDDLRWDGAVREKLDPLLDTLGFGRIRDRIARWQ
ncbi:MAG: exodeoxyribonuclease IX [Planctomycetota bacterium]|nr:exodeoxyribonuclease IX [Planctomycetota bacterium]